MSISAKDFAHIYWYAPMYQDESDTPNESYVVIDFTTAIFRLKILPDYRWKALVDRRP